MALDRRTVVYVDVSGKTTAAYLTGVGSLASIQTEILNVSLAAYQSYWEGPLIKNTHIVPTSGTYQSVRDSAILTFITGAGTLVTLRIPAPDSAIFLADQETVNASAIASLIAACIGNLSDISTNPVTAYVSGTRSPS